MQRAVYRLIEKVGYQIQEEEDPKNVRCCGMGGMVGSNNPVLSFIIGEKRTEGIPPSSDIVTYCAACREALVQYHPTVHVLDLLFNPKWEQEKQNPSLDDKKMRENWTYLKLNLEKEE